VGEGSVTAASIARAPGNTQPLPCTNLDPELFFPEDEGYLPPEVARACMACPIRVACLEAAMTGHVPYGIWGGVTERERRLRRRRARRAALLARRVA
jgi:WhiB family transcriptional regulator, redox-sensing transcriptional regulator